ncbi:translesion error-prone DNA polymerase V autoproteolytic subunit [Hymenobacter sp. BT175]|uniref:LexA family protein n=1 Tax=Hymenobacter translucens TaxID=2886507 RepID=UPI001D0E1A05|nr:translesion error-prone DNA polymerase V autoproteolytic subunit [Hymenobacter translucens]MCC2548637.1 translesion error-prone DNA polymerase V autoproteolytic subunit [Hymenobacter translucens]
MLTLPAELLALKLPFYTCLIPAGFPSPAEDYEEQPLDLNRYLFTHPASTFLARITGDSMTGAGIHPGDIITVDRAIAPADGHIVVAVVDGEHTVKRLRRRHGRVWLEAENDRYPALELLADSRLDIWGVVTHVIHSFVSRKAAGSTGRN